MSGKRQLKRKLLKSEDYKSDSDFEDEIKVSNKTSRKKRALLGSDSDNESVVSAQSSVNSEKKVEASSSEDEPLSCSSDSSDDETLAAKSKKARTASKSLESKKRIESDDDNEDFVNQMPKISKSKKMNSSSNSSDDEPLAAKSKNTTSENFNSKKRIESSDDDDEPVSKIAKTSKSKKVNSSYASSDDDEPLASKNGITTENLEAKNKSNILASNMQDTHLVKSSDDNAEPVSKITETSNSKKLDSTSDSSDDEPLAAKCKNNTRNSTIKERVESSDEDEPISKITKTSNLNKKSKKLSVESSDNSGDELKPSKNKAHSEIIRNGRNHSSGSEESGCGEASYESEPKIKLTKTSQVKKVVQEECSSSNSSDDEPLAVKKSVKQKTKNKANGFSEDDAPLSNLTKASKQKSNAKKTKSPSNGRIERMKKYLRLSGIHIQCYEKLFENCKSVKSKVEKMLAVLHENGMKGQPTIEKCKKLRKKIERKKEVAELDTSNIIKSEGRPKRGSSEKNIQRNHHINTSPVEKRFSRLKDIIDSEESD